jgi:prepilin-type N-terminal cleavage/methylation domain-containing protein
MLSKIRQTKKDQGFTIIEVLIVLAIAGLIMLVVFLAVPALQRNSRNTQRITDAGNVLTGISEYVGNNNGQLPPASATSGSGASLTIGASGSNTIPVKLGYYDAANVSITDYSAANAVNPDDTDELRVVRGAACDTGTIGDATNTGASTRSIVILYTLENSSKQCRAS